MNLEIEAQKIGFLIDFSQLNNKTRLINFFLTKNCFQFLIIKKHEYILNIK